MIEHILLTTSNLIALLPFRQALLRRKKVLALIIFASMMASISYHMIEQDKHHITEWKEGKQKQFIEKTFPFSEFSLLFWDRIFALLVGMWIVTTRVDLSKDIKAPKKWEVLGMIAFIVNASSECGYVGFCDPLQFDKIYYTALHSIWHILIYYSAYLALLPHLNENKDK